MQSLHLLLFALSLLATAWSLATQRSVPQFGTQVTLTDVGQGECRTAAGESPPRMYTAGMTVDTCKAECAALSWCQGVATGGATSFCHLYIAVGESNPILPTGFAAQFTYGCGTSCAGPIAGFDAASSAFHCYQKVVSTVTTTTVPPPSQERIIALMLKFKNMQIQMDDFTTEVQQLQDSIVQVAYAANKTGAGVLQAETDMVDVGNNAAFNANETVKLIAGADEAMNAVDFATKKTKLLKSALVGLEGTSTDIDFSAAEVGHNIAHLEYEVNELLPDGGLVQPRITAAEASLQKYNAELASGEADKDIATMMRVQFIRQKRRVQKLAAEIRVKQLSL